MGASRKFSDQVYARVAAIPVGRVTTYGRIAHSMGCLHGARMVGWALRATPVELDLPCHRVVNRFGELSGGWCFGHPDVMRALLRDEGVPFAGEYQVDLPRCGWDPLEDGGLSATDGVNDFNGIAVNENGCCVKTSF